jgi:hypothetical protein
MRSPDYCRFHSLTDPRQHCSNYECNVNVTCQACGIGTSAEVFSRSHDAVIRVYNDAGKGGRPPLVAPNIERRAIPVPDAHSCVLGAPF